MPTERINIVVTSKGTVTVRKEIEAIGTAGTKAAGGVDFLKGSIATLVSGAALSSLISYADTYTNIENKLRLVTTGTEQLSAVNEKLFQTAQQNRTSYEALVGFYQKASGAIQGLGGSISDAINFTDLFTKSVALSGVSVQTGEQAVYQFTQALNKGKLDGDEFKSVMEGLPYVVDILTKSLGVTKGELYALSASGKLSVNELVNALTNASTQIKADFASVAPTIGSALQVLDNAFLKLIGTENQATGVGALFANSIIFIAHNLNLFLLALTPLIVALTFLAIETIAGLVVGAFTSFLAVMTRMVVFIIADLIPAIVGLTVALLTNPLFLVGTAVAISAIAGLVIFRDQLGLTDQKISETKANLLDFFTSIGTIEGNGIDVNLKGGEVKDDILGAMSKGGLDAAGKVVGGHQKGGADAAELLKNGIKAGAVDAASTLASAQQAGIAEYERLNGKAATTMGSAIVDGAEGGAKYLYNSVTGATTKAAGDVQTALSTGGETAGASMKTAIVQGGQQAAGAIYSTIESAYATLGPILEIFRLGFLKAAADINLVETEQMKNQADAKKALAEAEQIRRGGGGGGGSSGSGGGGRGNGSVTSSTQGPINLRNVNVVDPRDSLGALDTGDGVRTMLNVIKTNPDDFRAALGVV